MARITIVSIPMVCPQVKRRQNVSLYPVCAFINKKKTNSLGVTSCVIINHQLLNCVPCWKIQVFLLFLLSEKCLNQLFLKAFQSYGSNHSPVAIIYQQQLIKIAKYLALLHEPVDFD